MTSLSEKKTPGAIASEARPPLSWQLFKLRFREWLVFESFLFRKTAGIAGLFAGLLLYTLRQSRRGFDILAKIHRANYSSVADALTERLARRAAHNPGHRLRHVYRDHIDNLQPIPHTAHYFNQPSAIFKYFAKIVKSHRANEKGVIILEYNYILPAFARLFDLEQVARRYHLVLEPSWSGYCTLDVLTYSQYKFPVFVQAYEPRDAAFIQNLRANLIPVPTSTNWWVDHRLFNPSPDVAKEFDLIMIAAWGAYKRHHRFFHALRDLRLRGHRLSALLLGYPNDMSLKEILDQARFYGVEDQLEVHEGVPYKQVNDFLNRAKINIIWSRKEGVNRAIIEGMFAGIPCLVREGFNYGYKYSYINEQTGCFSTERQLPDTILSMLENHARFNPRAWVMENMSCQRATAILNEKIKEVAIKAGEPWTEDLTPKVNWLQGMGYWNPEDEGRFAEDIAYLTSTIRTSASSN